MTELQETQKSLCLNLLSRSQMTDFVLACGAEDEDDDVSIEQVHFFPVERVLCKMQGCFCVGQKLTSSEDCRLFPW